jgi:superfamily II DNA or RNA helicase
MPLTLSISPHGRLLVQDLPAGETEDAAPLGASEPRIERAFAQGESAGLLHLATVELQSPLPTPFSFAREIGRTYLTRLCHAPELEATDALSPIAPPPAPELEAMVLRAPPMKGLEYVTADVLAGWWSELDAYVRAQIATFKGTAQEFLRDLNPLWRMVGRVTFHLAENKRDPSHPFAFMATYSSGLSAQGRLQHLPLRNALQEYAGAKNKDALISLLLPIQRASEKSPLAKELVESADVYHAIAWSPREAFRFLKEIPAFEEAGLVVKVPDWWKSRRPPRPQVSVRVGEKAKSKLGTDALLDFSAAVTLEGQELTPEELNAILESTTGLVSLRGKWVEVDRDRLSEALTHWKKIERDARDGGISFIDGMRLLAGANMGDEASSALASAEAQEWTGIAPGQWLDEVLADLHDPQKLQSAAPQDLHAELRPYQLTGVGWLRFMTRLRLGACLADDMGLGKTIQVLSLLLHLRKDEKPKDAKPTPSLLIVPASLVGNWKSEIARFAPSLQARVIHASEPGSLENPQTIAEDTDLVITTYGMLMRTAWLRERQWRIVILDEAQAIKNAGARQTRAVKELKADARIAMTGTPVENRLGDLWSLFDFLNPGLLGGAKTFGRFVKRLKDEEGSYLPLRRLVQPYILRRLKTDKRVIADLPDKTEVNAFCTLSKRQAVLYEQSVAELARKIGDTEGIRRQGLVLSFLMRFKQICNHPAQWLGDGAYDPQESGKFQRLAEICGELAERQDKALIFTQFREITGPLSEYLETLFGRPGLVLHGGTPVTQRKQLVEAFQREDGPPFFVLSLKAGGTGLNLTQASHVIHFDRWWNPAVENQATDRAFRIGQKRNVLVHKFVCRGTVEDKIDELIREKVGLSSELLGGAGGGEKLLTEMDDKELLRFVSLDIRRAVEA